MTDQTKSRGRAAPPSKSKTPPPKPAKDPRPVPPASLTAIFGTAHDPRFPANKRAHSASPTLAGMAGIRGPKKPNPEEPPA